MLILRPLDHGQKCQTRRKQQARNISFGFNQAFYGFKSGLEIGLMSPRLWYVAKVLAAEWQIDAAFVGVNERVHDTTSITHRGISVQVILEKITRGGALPGCRSRSETVQPVSQAE